MPKDAIESSSPFPVENDRTALSKAALKRAFRDNLFYEQGKFPALATEKDYYLALAYTVRDRLLHRWVSTAEEYTNEGSRTVAYFSAEFLMGPHLGNGGLGRLAACFLDSLATLEIPSLGYGIRYEYGIFEQEIVDGWQVERTDKWLRFGNPWDLMRPEWAAEVSIGGRTERSDGGSGRAPVRWIPERTVIGIPYDTPILGYRTNTANTLRLWRAEAPESFDFQVFNRGDYFGAVNNKVFSENITKVLYPNDESIHGKELRLEQQFFFVSCSLQDMFRILQGQKIPVERFHEKYAIQLNDTHPAIAVPELMRLLVDIHGVEWEKAWDITQKTISYTNHTIMPEALERWPVSMFARLLPRHLEIIYDINATFLTEARARFPGDAARIARMSLIDESYDHHVRMANLACVGSHDINGVAALHTELLKEDVLSDFHALWPAKFSNKTNGVTPRRWMVLSNPKLAALISDAIGDGWITDLDELRKLEPFVDDSGFRAKWREIKRFNKSELASFAEKRTGMPLDPESLFDVQVKRIHEYKRQHLNILHVIALYNRMKADSSFDPVPRTFIFGGKAAPGYHMAKLIIKLINAVSDVLNRDETVRNRLKVVFLPNFNVTSGQRIYPAAELSEQISTAGKEASGTGNMKFCMNGALTIGTFDGANIEILEEVGEENFFLFGLKTEEIAAVKAQGYRPSEFYDNNPELREVIDLVRKGFFSRGDADLFRSLIDTLVWSDPFMVMADFQFYSECQARVNENYKDQDSWTRKSILNTARSGRFSSDRTIREYCREIWRVQSVPIRLLTQEEVKARAAQ